jgi:hypothetical protein
MNAKTARCEKVKNRWQKRGETAYIVGTISPSPDRTGES